MTDQPASTNAAGLAARLAVIAFAILQILTPMLPSLGIGEPIGSRSDSTRTLITPAGWAFSIWGLLYLGSIVFALYQALPAQRSNALLARIRWPAAGAFLGNASWAVYTQLFGLTFVSAIIIFFTLGCLLAIFREFASWTRSFTAGERWCAVLPLSALASWLTAASIVNVAGSLKYHGVDAGAIAPLIAAIIVVVGGLIVSAALFRSKGNPAYALVFLWALSAILAQGGMLHQPIATACGFSAVVVIVASIVGLRRGGAAHWFG